MISPFIVQVSINDVHKFHTMDIESEMSFGSPPRSSARASLDGTNTVVFDFDQTLTKETVENTSDSNVFGLPVRKQQLKGMIEAIQQKHDVIVLTLNQRVDPEDLKSMIQDELGLILEVIRSKYEVKSNMFDTPPIMVVDDVVKNLHEFKNELTIKVQSHEEGLTPDDMNYILSQLGIDTRVARVNDEYIPLYNPPLTIGKVDSNVGSKIVPKVPKKKKRSRRHTGGGVGLFKMLGVPDTTPDDDDDDGEGLFRLRL